MILDGKWTDKISASIQQIRERQQRQGKGWVDAPYLAAERARLRRDSG